MSEVTISPVGHYVLVEALVVEDKTQSGIYLGDANKEQSACEFGVIKAFGPTCFVGIDGCDPSKYQPHDPRSSQTPYQLWGIDIGDQVEYRRYEGKNTGMKGVGNLRYIPDAQIIGKVIGDIKLTAADF